MITTPRSLAASWNGMERSIDQRHAVVHFNPARLQIEDRLDRRPAGALLCLWRGLVGAAIGVNDEMDGRAVDLQKVETQLGVDQGENLGPRIKPVDMGIGQFTPALQPVDGQAIHFHREMAQVPVQGLQSPPGHRWRPRGQR